MSAAIRYSYVALASETMAYAISTQRQYLRPEARKGAVIRRLPTEEACAMLERYIKHRDELRAAMSPTVWNCSA